MREVVAAVPKHWPPQYGIGEDGRPTGFAIDIFEAVAAKAGLHVTYRVGENFPEVLDMMRERRADVIPNLGIIPSRLADFAFTEPVETFGVSLFVRSDSNKVDGVDDLADRSVAVVKYNVGERLLDGRNDIDLQVFPDVREAIFELLSGNVDVLVYPRPVVTRLVQESGVEDRVKVVGKPLVEIKRGIAVHADDAELLALLDPAARAFVGSSAYRKIYVKWYGDGEADWITEEVVWTLGILLLLTVATMGGWRYASVIRLNRRLMETIDERRRAETALSVSEQKLQRSEDYFRALIENATDLITVLHQDGTILFESNAIEVQFGYTSEELLGRNALEFVHPDDRKRVAEALSAVGPEPGPGTPVEFRLRHKDGRWRQVSSVGTNAMENPNVEGIVIISRDITEARAMEEQLRQAQKMEAVGRLTGGVAHDFNNLLAVIMGNLELLDERLDHQPKLRALAEKAFGAAERGATLTQRLLAYSRRQPLAPQVTDLKHLVLGMIDLLGRTLGETVEVVTMLPGDLWPAAVDTHQLENALVNLALNARDAMPGGGKLTIEAANAHLDAAYTATHDDLEPGDYTVVAVSDTGTGIAPGELDRVFEPFFTTKGVGQGSGLGLSMVYGFAKQSGGHVSIYSEPGQGTTVKIYLPRAVLDQAAVVPEHESELVPQGHGETVLVVEDDAAVRDACLDLLGDLGYAALAARDGNAALTLLDDTPDVALLFTDVVLPGGMSGTDLAPEALRRRPGLKVLYTSGYTENAVIHHGRLDDDVELIGKPYRKAQLARKLRAVIDG